MTTSTLRALLATAFVPLALSCTPQGAGSSREVEAFEKELHRPGAQLIDVRTPAEYAQGHLAGARNLDWSSGAFEKSAGQLDRSKPVLLYCASGRRSAAAREHLLEQGFTEVVDLEGGAGAWVSSGRSLVH